MLHLGPWPSLLRHQLPLAASPSAPAPSARPVSSVDGMKHAPIHGYYWAIPVLTALVWFATLVTMLGLWAHDGHPRYKPSEPIPVFLSDVGAAHHHAFEGLCIATAALYMITILTERWLRHLRRIPGSITRKSTWFDWACVFWTWIGCLGLIFLSIFDAFHYSTPHWTMTVVFVVGILLGVFFQCLEIYSLAASHRGTSQKVFKTLFTISTVKAAILIVAIILAICFAVLYRHCDGESTSLKHANCSAVTNAAAGCEWALAFVLFAYFFSHVADFWDARHRYGMVVDEDAPPLTQEDQTLHSPIESDKLPSPATPGGLGTRVEEHEQA